MEKEVSLAVCNSCNGTTGGSGIFVWEQKGKGVVSTVVEDNKAVTDRMSDE